MDGQVGDNLLLASEFARCGKSSDGSASPTLSYHTGRDPSVSEKLILGTMANRLKAEPEWSTETIRTDASRATQSMGATRSREKTVILAWLVSFAKPNFYTRYN